MKYYFITANITDGDNSYSYDFVLNCEETKYQEKVHKFFKEFFGEGTRFKDGYNIFNLKNLEIRKTQEISKEEFEVLKKEVTQNQSVIKKKKISTFKDLIAYIVSLDPIVHTKTLILKKDFILAKEIIEKHLIINPNDALGFYLLGYIYGELGEFELMITKYNNSLSINKKYQKSINASIEYHFSSNYNNGVAAYNSAIKINIKRKARLLFKESFEYFKNALECKSNNEETFQNIVYALINLGSKRDLKIYLNEMIKNNNSEFGYEYLSQIYIESALSEKNNSKSNSMFDKAITVLETGHLKYPSNKNLIAKLSNAYIARNKTDLAKKLYVVALKKYPNNKSYHYNYGTQIGRASCRERV